jgi:hypothetical protein
VLSVPTVDLIVYATEVRLPAFTPEIHQRFREAEICCYRVPPYSDRKTYVTLMLRASSAPDAHLRVVKALELAGYSPIHPVTDVVGEAQSMPGTPLTGDGLPR